MQIGVEVSLGFWPLINTKNVKFIYIGKEKISQQSYNKVIALPSNYTLKEKDIKFIKSVKLSINFNK